MQQTNTPEADLLTGVSLLFFCQKRQDTNRGLLFLDDAERAAG